MFERSGIMEDFSGGVDPLRQMGLQLFNRTYLKGMRGRLFGASRLLDLNDTGVRVVNQHDLGIRDIALKQVVGSGGRSREFDRKLRPMARFNRDRWVSVATARLKGIPLPPVELIQIGEDYFIRDGHHRLSVAAALGQEFIEARVLLMEES